MTLQIEVDPEGREFYEEAAAAAASLAVCIDIFAVAEEVGQRTVHPRCCLTYLPSAVAEYRRALHDLESDCRRAGLQPLSRWQQQQAAPCSCTHQQTMRPYHRSYNHPVSKLSMISGCCHKFPCWPSESSSIVQDIYRRLGAPLARGGLLRLRTTPDIRIARAYGHLFPDDQFEHLFHVISAVRVRGCWQVANCQDKAKLGRYLTVLPAVCLFATGIRIRLTDASPFAGPWRLFCI